MNQSQYTRLSVMCQPLMPYSYYRWYIPRLEVLLGSGTASKDSTYLQIFGVSFTLHVVQPRVIGVRRNACVLQLPSEVRMRTCYTVVKHPCTALCHRITPKDVQSTTLYTPWTTPSVTIERNSSAHAHVIKFKGGIFKLFKNSVGLAR